MTLPAEMKARFGAALATVAVMIGVAADAAHAPPVVNRPTFSADPEALVELARDYDRPKSRQYFGVYRKRQARWLARPQGPFRMARLLSRSEMRRVYRRRAAVYRWSERRERRRAYFTSPDRHDYEIAWWPKTRVENGARVPAGDNPRAIHIFFSRTDQCPSEGDWRCDPVLRGPPRVVQRLFNLMRSLRTKATTRAERRQREEGKTGGNP